MALEQQIKSAIEAATAELAGRFQERLHALAAELGQEASAQHARELEEVVARVRAELTSQHESALEALRAEAAEQRDLAVAMARTEDAEQRDSALAALKAELAARHESETETLRAQFAAVQDAAREALQAELTAQHASAIEALRAQLAAEQDAALSAAVESARADAELRQESALAGLGTELSAQHEAALEALRAELTSRHDETVAGLRAQLAADHDAALAAALAAAREEAAQRQEAAVAAIRTEADERVARARAEADELLAHARAEADERLAAARAEADASAAEAIAVARAETVHVSDRELADARAAERQSELAFAERLSDAVRRLDSARSLIEVLDVLVDASAREAPRVAIFLVRGQKLAGWRAAGFSRDNDPRELEVSLDQAGLLTKAVRSSAAVTTSDAASGDLGSTPFGTLPAASAAVAVPLRVGGETVGVLYADDVSVREHEVPSVWPESVDVLARHACRCLEVVTITRVTQPITIPAPSSPTPTPRRYTPQARTFQPGHDDDDDAARRYARLLVSEIKLYHESAVTAGRRDRNLLERLRTEIDRARRLYGERVPPAVQARTEYFDQELVRTLANGDASLLGPA
jgi:hypothetical protein